MVKLIRSRPTGDRDTNAKVRIAGSPVAKAVGRLGRYQLRG
jgi:hypothetical protein